MRTAPAYSRVLRKIRGVVPVVQRIRPREPWEV